MKFIDRNTDPWPAERLMTLAQWQAARDTWPANQPAGVALANDEDPRQLAADVSRLAVIALNFPKWVDGRAYSQARLLRSRWGYRGELRAVGEVLVDMLPLLDRTGFDAVLLRADQSVETAQRALAFFPGHYQGDVHDNRPRFARPEAR